MQEANNLCYSTDKKVMGDIKGNRPKYHLSREQKLNREVEHCRRTSDPISNKKHQDKLSYKFKLRYSLKGGK